MPAGVEVVPLQLGHVTPRAGPFSGRRTLIQAFLIQHADGAILVDTGVGSGHPGIDKLYERELVPLTDALSDWGFKPSDVVAVINTHLHFDHCGQNQLFAGVPIYVQAAEYEAAAAYAYTVPEWFRFEGAAYQQRTSEAEVADGVSVVPTPGHTPGHQSVRVETSSGLAFIAGHAAYTAAEYAGEEPAPGGDWDDVEYAQSLALLRTLDPQRVYFSHDAAVWERDG
jgi:glyoxylase-like metal-dependent hydrolase (beta-lactamase superfamily II)